MKKILILIISLMGTLALTSCENSTIEIGNFGCAGNTTSTRCNAELIYRKTFKSSDEGFDASLARLNLSQSNVNLVTPSGTFVLSIKNTSGSVVASSVFNWYSIGNIIYPSDTLSMSNWVNSHLQNDYLIGLNIAGIETDGQVGNNTLIAVFEYGGFSTGASQSFYLNNADINGF